MPDDYVVRPTGELDMANVGVLLKEWLAAIDEHLPQRFVFDLAAVTFLDSTALGAIARVHNRQRAHGARVVITNASDNITRTLQFSGIAHVIEVNPAEGTTRAT
jgi:anti-anti-sigma factor